MPSRFKISMKLENIGPHYGENELSFSEEVDSNKSIIYAINGTGKSFISRAFRLCSHFKAGMIADEILTIGKQTGNLSFEIQTNNIEKKLKVSIRRGYVPDITNSMGLLFHTFNSDYVEENIRPKHYTPDGNIEGYILGKAQIDLTEERNRETALKTEIDRDDKAIDATVADAKTFLRSNGVTANTTEFQAVTRKKAENGFNYCITDSVEKCLQEIKALEGVLEDLADISLSVSHENLSFLVELKDILLTAYPNSGWDEIFVKEYKDHQSFIEQGLDIKHSEKICPFCKRVYDSDALNLINRYNKYRKDQESRIIAKLRGLQQCVDQVEGKLVEKENEIKTAKAQLIIFQKYFPSLSEFEIEDFLKREAYEQAFTDLSELIANKITNLSLQIDDIDKIISKCDQCWVKAMEIQERNQKTIERVNKTKNDARAERRLLRRNLCKAKSILLEKELKEAFGTLKNKKERLKKLQKEIFEKEQRVKISKREKVFATLEDSLNRFFNGKYQIDKDTFQIKFLGNPVGDNASSILSDGEKSIVAFCWYLAETHMIVNRENDYNKLFFVIDDPISSMDFHYVYAVAQIIREIKTIFGITTYERIWILTHNMEFFSIVMRNNILKNAFMMKPGSIERFNHKLLMPYENHLLDLMAIVNGTAKPSHTTGNSIRHVIETISKFENPEIGIDKYVRKEEMLSKDSCIFSLCQDLSHGNIRLEPPYSEEMLKEAAKKVIEFVKTKYPGQLNSLTQ